MPRLTLTLLLLCFFGALSQVHGNGQDAYLVLYATHDGQTGHVGLAVDKQRITIADCQECPGGVRYDTVKTGELLYFDIWPASDDYTYSFFFGSVPAHYYRLPNNTTARPITISSLTQVGLPHALEGSCDGLLQIKTSAAEDRELIHFLQSVIDTDRPFNLYEHNCTDFVLNGLKKIRSDIPAAEELVLARRATTPNKLWYALAGLPKTAILKDPGTKTAGRFNSQRIFSTIQF